MIELLDLSKEERFVIAEYLYSQSQGILIKSDAEAVIEVFKRHNVEEANTIELEEYAVLMLIKKNIKEQYLDKIMNDYYTRFL